MSRAGGRGKGEQVWPFIRRIIGRGSNPVSTLETGDGHLQMVGAGVRKHGDGRVTISGSNVEVGEDGIIRIKGEMVQ